MYAWLLFGHIVGVVLVMGAGVTQAFGGAAMRRATTAGELRAIQRVVAPSQPLGGVGMLLLLATGLTMTASNWSFTDPWISTSIGLLVAAIVTSLLLAQPRSRRLNAALGATEPAAVVLTEVIDAARDRIMHVTQRVLLVMQFEIVLLMVRKPTAPGILGSLLAAAVVAAAVSAPVAIGRSQPPGDRDAQRRHERRIQPQRPREDETR